MDNYFRSIISIVVFLSFLLLSLGFSKGANIFERTLQRFQCLKPRSVEGCNGKLIERYTNVSLSSTNGTEAETYFYLFTRKNPDEPEFLHDCEGQLPSNTNFDAANPTVMVVHGFLDGVCRLAWMREIKDQLLIRGPYNVILTDWTWGNTLDFYDSVQNSYITAAQMSIIINNIKMQTGVDYKNFHLVGHSLGGQIVGIAGQGAEVRRITGLDPAGPGFYDQPNNRRLDKSDAKLVDVIHTNAGRCLPFFGYKYNLGHSDFYVNGGSIQLSCYSYSVESIFKGDILYSLLNLLLPSLCFHTQAFEYFKASIKPSGCEFVGVECESYEAFKAGRCKSCGKKGSKCETMGMDWEISYKRNGSSQRTFYLDTSLKCPWCDNSKLNLTGFPDTIGIPSPKPFRPF